MTTLFGELQTGMGGYWEDSLGIDRLLIEFNKCPKCRNRLVYKGYSNALHYKAFGICTPCEFARLFWTEPVVFVKRKKRFSAGSLRKKAKTV